jgi:hypothetical protein
MVIEIEAETNLNGEIGVPNVELKGKQRIV